MRLPAVPDATVRYILLTAVGVLLLAVLPGTALGARPLWRLLGQPGPTLANLIGIIPMAAAWVYFLVVVVVKRAAWSRGVACRLALTLGGVALAGALTTLLLGLRTVGIGLLLFAAATHLVVAFRVGRGASVIARSESEAPGGLP
jgi:hypothetical protein